MPLSAIAHVEPDAVLPIAAMARWILEHNPQTNRAPTSSQLAHDPTADRARQRPTLRSKRRIWRSSTPRATRRGRRRAKARATPARTAAACCSSATRASSSASSAASATSSRSRACRAPRPRRSRTRCGPPSAPSRTAPRSCSRLGRRRPCQRRSCASAVAFERQAGGGARAGAHDPRRPSRAPPPTARSRLSRERAGRAAASEDGSETAARRPPRVPQAHARLRLHRLQAREPRAPDPQAHGGGRASSDYSEYLDYLEVHPDEFAALFDTILINVTAFFRDPPAWDYCAERGRPAPARGESAPTSRSASGAPAAPPARRRTRSRWCSPRRWATRPSASA